MTLRAQLVSLTFFVYPLVGQTFEALMAHGVDRYNTSDFHGAVTQFEKAVELEPKSTLDLLHLANAHASRAAATGDMIATSRALALYDQALAIEPKNRRALWNQAMLKLRGEDLDGAEAALDRYLQLAPGSAHALYAQGVVAWSRAFPAQVRARREALQHPRDPPPIAEPSVRDEFRREYATVVDRGIESLLQASSTAPSREHALLLSQLAFANEG